MLDEYNKAKETHYKELKGLPNARLTGGTFDARHLDRFMHTEHGEKAAVLIPQDVKELKYGTNFSGDPQLIPIQSNIRPDPCFLTVPRYMRKGVVNEVSSKPMQLSHQRVNVLEKSPYKGDYQKLNELQKQFDHKKLLSFVGDKSIQSAQDRRKEIEEMKQNMKKLHEYKEAHAFANKRDRVIKGGWKNGIQGVDSVMNPNTFFYKEQQELLVNRQAHDYEINEKNRECNITFKD